MNFVPNPENSSQPPPLAPPRAARNRLDVIFWNDREFRAGWRLLVFLLFIIIFALSESWLMKILAIPLASGNGITVLSLLVKEVAGVLAVFAATALMAKLEGRPFGIYGLPRAAAFGVRFWQGVAWGLAMVTTLILLICLFRGFSFGTLALHGQSLWGHAAAWAIVFLCVGFFEEFLFRGYAQFTLAMGIGFWPAGVGLSVIFGAGHLRNVGEDLVGALSVVVIALFFCLTLRRTGNLWFAVGLHAAFDWGESYLFSVPDSGIIAPGHLLNSSFHGPAWLTGGAVGPEGSVMAFAVVAMAAVLFVFVYPASEESARGRPE